MSGGTIPATCRDTERRLRVLYDALIEARPYVFNRAAPDGHTSDSWRAAAADVLERVDAALADAQEVL